MQKIINFEKKYTIGHMVFMLILTVVYSSFFYWKAGYKSWFFWSIIIGWAFLVFKTFVLEKEDLIKWIIDKRLYNIIKLIELVVTAMLVIHAKDYNFELTPIYFIVVLEAYIANENLDEPGYKFFYTVPFLGFNLIYFKAQGIDSNDMLYVVFITSFLVLVQIILDLNSKQLKKQMDDINELIQEKNDKNQELENSQKVLEKMNGKLKLQKIDLEKATEKFRSKAAQFYVLKEIGIFLGTSLEVEGLLELVVDVLSGVMGVNMCCIVLYPQDYNSNTSFEELKFHIKTVYDDKTIELIKEKVKSGAVSFFMNNREIYVDNDVNETKNLFYGGRDIGSFVAVPLYKDDKNYGIVILEQRYKNYFPNSVIELLKSVANQIVLSIENARLYESVEELAIKDPLTKVYNRGYMQRVLPEILSVSEKENKSVAVSIFDIDDFKKVNDTYGHLFGDKVLKIMAKIAKDFIKEYNGVLIRYGGEEFLVILPDKIAKEGFEIIEELRKKIENTVITEGVIKMSITVSFGVSAYPEIVKDKDRLIVSADNAVYKSKENGKNQVSMADIEK